MWEMVGIQSTMAARMNAVITGICLPISLRQTSQAICLIGCGLGKREILVQFVASERYFSFIQSEQPSSEFQSK